MSRFRFTSELPDDQLFQDVLTLNLLNVQQLEQFIGIMLAFLADKADLAGPLTAFAQANGINLNALKSTARGSLTFMKAALRQNMTPANVKDDLIAFGISEEKASAVAAKWRTGLADLSRTAAGQTLTVNELIDMDWRFGVTAASSEMQQVGATFLQLRLVLNKGNKTENVYIELTLQQFYEFLHEMERAKQNLDILR